MFRFITNRRTLYFTRRTVKKQTPRWFQVELRVNVTVHEREQNCLLHNADLFLQSSDAREILHAGHSSRSNGPPSFYFAYPTNLFSFDHHDFCMQLLLKSSPSEIRFGYLHRWLYTCIVYFRNILLEFFYRVFDDWFKLIHDVISLFLGRFVDTVPTKHANRVGLWSNVRAILNNI